MTRKDFEAEAARLFSYHRSRAFDPPEKKFIMLADLAERAGLAWDPPEFVAPTGPRGEKPDNRRPNTWPLDPPDDLLDQPEIEVVWQGGEYRLLANGEWQSAVFADGSAWEPSRVAAVEDHIRPVFAELARRLLAERNGACPVGPEVLHIGREAFEAPENAAAEGLTHPTFRQMALVLGRLEAAYLAAQEAGVQKGRLEGREGEVSGEVRWPYGYDKQPEALRVSVQARVPAKQGEAGDGQ